MTFIDWATDLSRKGSTVSLSGVPVAMHCHHYNINLQNMLETTLGPDGVDLMYKSAEESAYLMLREYFRHYPRLRSRKSKIEVACSIYQNCGLGILYFVTLNEKGGKALSRSSHHVTGWLAKHGRRDTPGCHFTRGWIAGFCAMLYGRPLGTYNVTEHTCKMMRDEICTFEIKEG